ncbi:AAA family ATPase [Alloscardovia criceti]|uniref:AAA family ATPase n=1 Tax=Alloscardovia criceti TaxID=356828 RepID=UPI0003806075|nr:AAA family ATPase [Alloscardovia criceti]
MTDRFDNPFNIPEPSHDSHDFEKKLKLTPAPHVKTVKPRYLDMPALPLDMVTLISGRAGVGKSTFALFKLALATTGKLQGDYYGKPINVAIFAKEDTQSMQKARLQAAGANLNRVFFGDAALVTTDMYGESEIESDITIPEDMPLLENLLKENDIRLILIDPLNSYMNGDTNRKDDVRRALDPLARMAQRLNISVIGVIHFGKGGGYASDKLSGSHAFRDVARSVLLVAKDDETGLCYVTLDKAQYSPEQGKSWCFSLQSIDIRTDEGESMSVARVANLEDTDKSVGEIINLNQSRDTDAAAETRSNNGSNEILEFLVEYLQNNDGHALTSEIKKEASEAGYEWRQVQNTRQRSHGKILSRQVKQYVYEWYITTPFQGVLDREFTELTNLTELTKNSSVSSVRQANNSKDLECVESDRTHALEDVSSVSSVSSVNVSNTSRNSNGVSSVNEVSSVNSVPKQDMSEFKNALPQYASDCDFTQLTYEQLHYLIDEKGGLWASKAHEELENRK